MDSWVVSILAIVNNAASFSHIFLNSVYVQIILWILNFFKTWNNSLLGSA